MDLAHEQLFFLLEKYCLANYFRTNHIKFLSSTNFSRKLADNFLIKQMYAKRRNVVKKSEVKNFPAGVIGIRLSALSNPFFDANTSEIFLNILEIFDVIRKTKKRVSCTKFCKHMLSNYNPKTKSRRVENTMQMRFSLKSHLVGQLHEVFILQTT